MKVEEFLEKYNSKVVEINGCSTMCLFSHNTFFKPKSLKIDLLGGSSINSSFSLESDFNEFYADNDFFIGESPLDTINKNFNIGCKSNEDAYCFFLEMKYNLEVSPDNLSLLESVYTEDFVREITGWFRHVEQDELREIIENYDIVKQFPGVLKYFSTTAACTAYLIKIMNSGLMNLNFLNTIVQKDDYFEELQKYATGEISIASAVVENTESDKVTLANRDDYCEIQNLLRETADVPDTLLHDYADFKYLPQLIIAFSRGLYNENFMHTYCHNDNSLSDYQLSVILNEYANGNFSPKYLQETNGNFYLTKLLSDLDYLQIQQDSLILGMQDPNILQKIHTFAVQIINARLSNVISQEDYYKYISLFCSYFHSDFVDCLLKECNHSIYSFNKYCFMALFNKVFNHTMSFDVPDGIGPFLCIINRNNQFKMFTVLDIILNITHVMDTIDNSLLGAPMQAVAMGDERGIFILPQGKEIQKDNLVYLKNTKNSLDNYLDTFRTDIYKNYNSSMTIMHSNYLALKETISVNEKLDDTITANVGMLLSYDLLFYRLGHDFAPFAGILSSSNYNAYLRCLNSLQICTSLAKTYFIFMDKIITTLVSEDKYKSSLYGIEKLTDDFIIDVIGISGFLNVSIKEFIDNLDRILIKILALPNIRLVVDKPENNRIIIKVWA